MTSAKKKIENMSDEELDDEYMAIEEQRAAWREKAAALQTERDRRALDKKLGTLSAGERAALVQRLEAEGVETLEEVGEPG